MTAESVARQYARGKKQLLAFLASGGQIGSDYTDERARDALALALRGGHGLGIAVDDAGDTITIDVTDPAAVRTVLGLGAAAQIDVATVAEYLAGTAAKAITAERAWAAAAPVALVDAATIALDFGAMLNGVVTLGGNRQLGNPSRVKPGQSGWIEFVQDATGNRQLAFGSAWRNTANIALSTAAGARDSLYFVAKAANRIEVTGFLKAIG